MMVEGLVGDRKMAWCRTVMNQMEEAVLVLDAAERIRFVNSALCRLTGHDSVALVGEPIQSLFAQWPPMGEDDKGGWLPVKVHGQPNRRHWVNVEAYSVEGCEAYRGDTVVFVRRDGKFSWKTKETTGDIDPLTGLMDRTAFRHLLSQLVSVRQPEQTMALLLIDIDRFEQINDVYSYDLGDALMKELAERIVQTVDKQGIVSRFTGDEFACLLTNVENVQEAVRFANTLREVILKPITVFGHTFQLTLSIGVSLCPLDADTAESLIQHANIAMYRAKEKGDQVQVFKAAMDVQVRQQILLENELRIALQNEDLSLHYQPQLDLASGRLTTVEVLLRWEHPEAGNISPAQFVPIAEETGIIIPMGAWVLRQACRQGAKWLMEGFEIQVAVNLSLRQFMEDDLVLRVKEALMESGLPPRLLELEVTESLFIENPKRVIDVMHEICAMGVRFALDDYGMGYSSLSYLKKLPIEVLKLDRSFIQGLANDRYDQAIVKSTITLARHLGLELVAEGVETQEQLQILKAWQCSRIQGYVITPPLSASEMTRFFRQSMFH